MKKIILLLIIFYVTATSTFACEICGCGAGSYYFGMMPQFHKNFFGVRYRYSSYLSHIGYADMFKTTEKFQTLELWGRYYIGKKWQILTFLPYNTHIQTDSKGAKEIRGIGDMSFLLNYRLITPKHDSLNTIVKHTLWIGGGVKLPTGKYDYNSNDITQVSNPNFQLGSGSTDFVFNTQYTARLKKWGINLDASVKINTKNKNDYRFGNRISGNLLLFYLQQIKKIGIMPSAGVYAENSTWDERNGYSIDATGGFLTNFSTGIDMYYKKYTIGCNFQTPFKQNLAHGHLRAENRWVAHFSFLF
ncbi:MAG: hypothetical protein EAY69_06835 [Cytophagales bacterium]|nr:MAG: hypothetical protein EAY69_06835 [Cytophagales bacterium]